MAAVLQLGQSRFQAVDLLRFDLLYEAAGKLEYRDQSWSPDCFSYVLTLVTTKPKALEVEYIILKLVYIFRQNKFNFVKKRYCKQ